MSDGPLSITTSPMSTPEATVLVLAGPVVIVHLFQFQTRLRELTTPLVVLDLSGVPYMDSSGLGAILNAFVSAQKNGRKVVLASVNERILALLQLTKVDTILKIHPDVPTALAN